MESTFYDVYFKGKIIPLKYGLTEKQARQYVNSIPETGDIPEEVRSNYEIRTRTLKIHEPKVIKVAPNRNKAK